MAISRWLQACITSLNHKEFGKDLMGQLLSQPCC